MTSTYDDFVTNFDLSHFSTEGNVHVQTKELNYEKLRKSTHCLKSKIISTDYVIQEYIAKTEEYKQVVKAHSVTKEDLKQTCINYKNVSEKCTALENENKLLIGNQEVLQKRATDAENNYSALISYTNQLQSLVKELETKKDALIIEKKLEKNSDGQVQLLQKEKEVMLKDIMALIDVVLDRKKKNKRHLKILKTYANQKVFDIYTSDDSADEIVTYKGPSHGKPKLNKIHKLADKNRNLNLTDQCIDFDSDSSCGNISVDTGRGSSRENSKEKWLKSSDNLVAETSHIKKSTDLSNPINLDSPNRSPQTKSTSSNLMASYAIDFPGPLFEDLYDNNNHSCNETSYIIDEIPIAEEIIYLEENNQCVDACTSPMPDPRIFVNQSTSPRKSLLVDASTSPISKFLSKTCDKATCTEIVTITEEKKVVNACTNTDFDSPNILQTHDRGTSPVHDVDSNMTVDKNKDSFKKSKSKNEHTEINGKSKEETNHEQQLRTKEKLCLENHNCDNLLFECTNDNEIQNILNVMSLHHDLISPIPKSPLKVSTSQKDINNTLSNIQGTLSELLNKFNSLEGKVGDMKTQYNHVKEDVTAIRKIVGNDVKQVHGEQTSDEIPYTSIEIIQIEEAESNTEEIMSHLCHSENANTTENLNETDKSMNDLNVTNTIKYTNTEVFTNKSSNNGHGIDSVTDLVEISEEKSSLNEQRTKDNRLDEVSDIIYIPHVCEPSSKIPDDTEMVNSNVSKVDNIKKLKKSSKLERFRNKLIPNSKIKQKILPHTKHRPIDQNFMSKDTSPSVNQKIAYENAVKVMADLKSKKAIQEAVKDRSTSRLLSVESRLIDTESSPNSESSDCHIVSTRSRTRMLSKKDEVKTETNVKQVVLEASVKEIDKSPVNNKGRKRSADEMDNWPSKRVLRSSNICNAANKTDLPIIQFSNVIGNAKTSEVHRNHTDGNNLTVTENKNVTSMHSDESGNFDHSSHSICKPKPILTENHKSNREFGKTDQSVERDITSEYSILTVQSDTVEANIKHDHLDNQINSPVKQMQRGRNNCITNQVSVVTRNNSLFKQNKCANESLNLAQNVVRDSKRVNLPQIESVSNNDVLFMNDEHNVNDSNRPHAEPNDSLLIQVEHEGKSSDETVGNKLNMNMKNTEQLNCRSKESKNESTTKFVQENSIVPKHIIRNKNSSLTSFEQQTTKLMGSKQNQMAFITNLKNPVVELFPLESVIPDYDNSVISYKDLDLYTSQTNIRDKVHRKCSKGNQYRKENILCAALDRYGVISVKYVAKKVPENITHTICQAIEDGIQNIIASPKNNQKTEMNELIVTIQSYKTKQILSGLMEYLKDPARKLELFNKINNGPAPPMTKAEVILLYVIEQLNKLLPSGNFIQQIWNNIEHALFQLNRAPPFNILESISHFYAVMCRYFRDKSRLRCFMLDAMYCLQFKAVPLIRQCVDVCPGVLPYSHEHMAKTSLVTCLVYLLHFYKCEDKFNRAHDIRTMLYRKYSYQFSDWNETMILEIFRKAIMNLGGTHNDKKMLRLALIILCKRHGATWCQANIIQNMLLPIIEKRDLPEKIKQFCVLMLGPLLKPFPADKKALCEIIINQLLQLLKQNPSHDMQEAIYTSLIFMNKHDQERVVQALLSWNPEKISPEFEEILNDYVLEKPLSVWKKLVSRKPMECT